MKTAGVTMWGPTGFYREWTISRCSPELNNNDVKQKQNLTSFNFDINYIQLIKLNRCCVFLLVVFAACQAIFCLVRSVHLWWKHIFVYGSKLWNKKNAINLILDVRLYLQYVSNDINSRKNHYTCCLTF